MINNPQISINIPVYNTAKYLPQLIATIQNQTFKDFEVIFVDDASTDDGVKIIRSYDDSRFKVIELNKNCGVSRALNIAADNSKGKYLLIMGSDDLMHPELFRKQYDFMELHPGIDVCGVCAQLFGERHDVWKKPETDYEIVAGLLFNSTLMHPGAIIRRENYEQCKCKYDETLTSAVDYDLWRQMIGKMRFHNLQEILLYYRRHTSQMSTAGVERQNVNAGIVRTRMFQEYFCDVDKSEIVLFNSMIEDVSDGCFPRNMKELDTIFTKMVNKNHPLFNNPILIDVFAVYITNFVVNNGDNHLGCLLVLLRTKIFRKISVKRKIRLILRVVKHLFYGKRKR